MKPYVWLAIGATWLIAAISLLRSSFDIVWTGKHHPVLVLALVADSLAVTWLDRVLF